MPPLFLVPNRFEAAYQKAISKLLIRELPFDISHDEVDHWVERLAAVSSDQSFIDEAERVARIMVRDVNTHNVHGWRESARRSYGGSRFFRYLGETKRGAVGKSVQEQIELSANLISSLPSKIAKKLNKEVQYARSQGITEQGVLSIIRRRFSPLINSRIRLLGSTDPHRTNTALTRARSEDFSLPVFLWKTAGDILVRDSHQRMEGVVCFWSDLPSPEELIGSVASLGHYAPGDCPGCRCTALPILSVNDLFDNQHSRIEFYSNGVIRWVTRAQFVDLVGS
jgi:hypothetical protein